MTDPSLALGVDGGATKTLGLLAEADGNIIARVQTGGSNVNVIGIEAAAKELSGLILRCCEEARRPQRNLTSVVLGLAGAGSEEERQSLSDAIHERLGRDGGSGATLFVESDARVALEGAFDGGPGIVVIAGTGSVVIGKSGAGKLLRTGGWGRILEDEGSGYHIGLLALKAIAAEFDGLYQSGSLSGILAERFGWSSREKVITSVYREKFDLAALAPLVIEAAEHDPVAKEILHSSATLLAGRVAGTIRQLGLSEGMGIVMTGSLIDHDTMYARMLAGCIREHCPGAHFRAPMHPPAEGALRMALTRLKKG